MTDNFGILTRSEYAYDVQVPRSRSDEELQEEFDDLEKKTGCEIIDMDQEEVDMDMQWTDRTVRLWLTDF